MNAAFIPNSNSQDEPLASLKSMRCLPADFSTPGFKKTNWNEILKSFLLDEWWMLKSFSPAFLCVRSLGRPGGPQVKMLSRGDEGTGKGNGVSLWNNLSVAALPQRSPFTEELQMCGCFRPRRGTFPFRMFRLEEWWRAPKSDSLFRVLRCCLGRVGFGQHSGRVLGTVLALTFLASRIFMQHLNRRKELIWFSDVKLKMKFLLAHPSKNTQWLWI